MLDILISIGFAVRKISGVSPQEEKNGGNCCMFFDIALFPLILKVTFEVYFSSFLNAIFCSWCCACKFLKNCSLKFRLTHNFAQFDRDLLFYMYLKEQ